MPPLFFLFVGPEFRDGEGLYVDLVKPFFHRRGVHFSRRVREMPRGAGRSSKHLRVGNRADSAFSIDDVWPDEKLVGLAVNHAICRSAADAFGADDLLQRRRDFVEFVARAFRTMRRIGHRPKPARPRNHGPRAAFAFIVKHREVRINARDAARLGGVSGRDRECGDGSGEDVVRHARGL